MADDLVSSILGQLRAASDVWRGKFKLFSTVSKGRADKEMEAVCTECLHMRRLGQAGGCVKAVSRDQY